MKVLLLPMGSHGDIHPYLGLGLRLKSRGHQVLIAANSYFETLFRNHGLEFIGLKTSSDYTRFYGLSDHLHPARALTASGRWCGLEPMREIFRIIADNYQHGNTVVAAPYYAFGARIAREKTGVPLATVVLNPYELRSIYRSPFLPRPLVLEDWVPRISKRIQFWVMDRFFADRILGPRINRFRMELGLPPVKRLLAGWCFSPDRVIGFFPDWYAPYQPDWPENTSLAGFPRWDPPWTVGTYEDVSDFIKNGDPPIIFTPGSHNQNARNFLAVGIESCMKLKRRGILLTRYHQQVPRDIPSTIRHFEYIPFEAFLSNAAALVSHGGIGTVARALEAGVPQILMPIAYNQPDEAVRLKRFGVAEHISPHRFRGALLAKKLKTVMDSPSIALRCKELAGRFPGRDSIDFACDLLEKLNYP